MEIPTTTIIPQLFPKNVFNLVNLSDDNQGDATTEGADELRLEREMIEMRLGIILSIFFDVLNDDSIMSMIDEFDEMKMYVNERK